MTEQVTLYTRPRCPFCTKLRAKLRMRGIAFEEIDIWQDEDAARVVREANGGDELVPTVRVGGRYLSNPRVADVAAALREEGPEDR